MDNNNKLEKITDFHIVYFSGTGCTAYVCERLYNSIIKSGINVRKSEIFQKNSPYLKSNETLIIVYPVYAANAPSTIFKWIDTIPNNNNRAIVVSVSGGGEVTPNTASRELVIKRLSEKGLVVTNEYMICMPSNCISPTQKNLALELLRILPEKVEKIIEEVLNNKTRRKKPYFRDKIIRFFCGLEKMGAKYFGRYLVVSDKCNSCGLCVKQCPTENISLERNIPNFSWNCVLCLRCIYSCPKKAINPSMMKMFLLKDGFNLKELESELKKNERIPYVIQNSGKLWDGVTQYIRNNDI